MPAVVDARQTLLLRRSWRKVESNTGTCRGIEVCRNQLSKLVEIDFFSLAFFVSVLLDRPVENQGRKAIRKKLIVVPQAVLSLGLRGDCEKKSVTTDGVLHSVENYRRWVQLAFRAQFA